jgi:hypothetical protein
VNRTVAGIRLGVASPFAIILFVFLSGCVGTASQSGSSGGGTTDPPPAAIAVTVSPTSMTVQTSQTQTLTATVANDSANKGVTWSVTGAGCTGAACGSVSPTSSASAAPTTYTAPATVPSPTTVTITATSVADGTKSAAAAITVSAPPVPISVTLSSTIASVVAAGTQAFTATVQGDSAAKGVNWTLSGAGCSGATCGTLSEASSASGAAITYTAPATLPNPATVTLTATSVTDTSKSAAATITVTAPPPVVVTVSPATASVMESGTQPFTATVQNDAAGKGVTWTLTGTGCGGTTCGTLSANTSASGTAITYTAPANEPTPATVTLTGASVTDPTKTASATITVTPNPAAVSVTLTPTTINVPVGGTQSFTATVQNDSGNKGVTWTLLGASCGESSCGTIAPASSASGTPVTYTAPNLVPTPATVVLRATSVADNTRSNTAAITITPPTGVSVALTPKRGGLTVGQSLDFMATVTNDVGGQGVTWSVTGGGAFTNSTATTATYVAPATAGIVTVTATSKVDVTMSASTTLGVTDLAGVFTYHNDISRDGANTQEYALTGPSATTPSNVSSSTFGKLFSCAVDGAVYAQPLWVSNVTINGANHNVVVVATAHDSLYLFDADANPCVMYWQANLLDIAHGGTPSEVPVISGGPGALVGAGFGDITPETGVIGTPVIDPTTHTIYVVSKSVIVSSSTFFQRLHAINLVTGGETLTPININSSVTYPGTGDGGNTVAFNPSVQLQRTGLALVNGIVYICWASHEDGGHYFGWVAGYRASDLSLVSTYNATPSSGSGGIWMGGGAPAADNTNNLYVITGNGNFDGTNDFGDSFLKLSTSNGLKRVDSFTPSNQVGLNNSNIDLGAGGAAIVINLPSQKQLLFGGGKQGEVYLLDSTAMGGYLGAGGTADNILQEFPFNNPIFSTAAFWQNTVYLAGLNGPVQALALNPTTGMFGTTPVSSSPSTYGFPGATPSVSSSGTTNGIVWALDNGAFCTGRAKSCGPTVLHAYDATNLGTELWNSGTTAGNAVKFTVPTIANGKVYVGTRGSSTTGGGVGEVDVYGLLPN